MILPVGRVYNPFPFALCNAPGNEPKRQGQARLRPSPCNTPHFRWPHPPTRRGDSGMTATTSSGVLSAPPRSDSGRKRRFRRKPNHRRLTTHPGPPVDSGRGDGARALVDLDGSSQKWWRDRGAHLEWEILLTVGNNDIAPSAADVPMPVDVAVVAFGGMELLAAVGSRERPAADQNRTRAATPLPPTVLHNPPNPQPPRQ